MSKPTVTRIKIETPVDEHPDLSYLGRFTNNPTNADWDGGNVIDRAERGELEPHEYRYFVGSDPDHIEQDYERMMDLEEGAWFMIGIHAVAEVRYMNRHGHQRIEWLTSSGLWGIESDSDHEYLQSVADDEIEDLKEHLTYFNIECPESVRVVTPF